MRRKQGHPLKPTSNSWEEWYLYGSGDDKEGTSTFRQLPSYQVSHSCLYLKLARTTTKCSNPFWPEFAVMQDQLWETQMLNPYQLTQAMNHHSCTFHLKLKLHKPEKSLSLYCACVFIYTYVPDTHRSTKIHSLQLSHELCLFCSLGHK